MRRIMRGGCVIMRYYVLVFLAGLILGGSVMLLPGLRYRREVHRVSGMPLVLYRFDRITGAVSCSIPNGSWIPFGVVDDFDPDEYLATH